MAIVCLQWSTILAVIWINMVVLDPLAIRGVIHSRNVSVRLIRSVHLSLHRSIRVFRVVMSLINTAVVLRQDTRTVPPPRLVNGTMIVVTINCQLMVVMWINMVVVRRQDIPTVPIPGTVNDRVSVKMEVCQLMVVMWINMVVVRRLDIPTVPIPGNVNDRVTAVRQSMNPSVVMATIIRINVSLKIVTINTPPTRVLLVRVEHLLDTPSNLLVALPVPAVVP